MLAIENYKGRLLHAVCLHRGLWANVWIVGSWTRHAGGGYIDWAAYIGAYPSAEADVDAVRWIKDHGTKTSRAMAVAVFGQLAERYKVPWRD